MNPAPTSTPTFAADRYDKMPYRRCGRSGLKLPAVSLGAWETFGGYRDADLAKRCLFRAFDLGITHFDLANNYGTPPGNAEIVVGKVVKEMPRDELILSSKAGYRMWPGPYGEWGSRKSILASCDQSLKRMGVDYFDLFYSHRFDPETPLGETLSALDHLVRQGKALYVGVSNYGGSQMAEAARLVERHGLAPLTLNQPRYNLLDRRAEGELFPVAERLGTGLIPFSPLAQGFLTDKYLGGSLPADSRAAERWKKRDLDHVLPPEKRSQLEALNAVAKERGQTLAQMALAWILRLPAVTSVLIGASRVAQVEENVKALENPAFTEEELKRIDALTRA